MATKRDYEILARLKLKKKEIEEKIKEKERKILDTLPESKVETPHGVLSLVTRNNYSIPSNQAIIDYGLLLDQDIIDNAKLAPSTLKKLVGEKSFEVLLEEGIVKFEGETVYYTLKQNKQ